MAVKSRNIMAKLTEAERQAAIEWLENVAVLASSESEQAIQAKYVLRIITVREDVIERQKNILNGYGNTIVRQSNTIVGQSNTIVGQRKIISGQHNFIKGQRTVARLQDAIIKCQDASITALMDDAHAAA